MVKSMNTKVIYTTKANSMTGSIGNKHGDIMVGDKAFEFYNHRNPEDYIQIPWKEIGHGARGRLRRWRLVGWRHVVYHLVINHKNLSGMTKNSFSDMKAGGKKIKAAG